MNQTMLQIGDTMRNKWFVKFVWAACLDCGKERWVQIVKGEPKDKLCNSCCQKKATAKWMHGDYRIKGYEMILLHRNSPFRPMSCKEGYVMKHRLIYAEYQGRCLGPTEIVHHKNGIITDNRIENLELMSRNQHASKHHKGIKRGETLWSCI